MSDRLLTPAEVAERTGLSIDTVRRALKLNQIPNVPTAGRQLVPEAALAEWLRTAGGWVPTAKRPVVLAAERRRRRKRTAPAEPAPLTHAERLLGVRR